MYSLFCYTAFLSIKTNIVTALYPPQMSVCSTQYILKSLSVSWTLLIFLAPLCSLVVFSMMVSTSSAEVYISFHYHWLFFEIQLIHHEFTHFKYKIQSFFCLFRLVKSLLNLIPPSTRNSNLFTFGCLCFWCHM